MARGQLPPQAYTREVLAQAYSWLRHQPDSIRVLAKSPDDLVSLFLRAKRNGDASLEHLAPNAQESFKSNLKNLSAELHQSSEAAMASTPTQPPPTIVKIASEPPAPLSYSSQISPLTFDNRSFEGPPDFQPELRFEGASVMTSTTTSTVTHSVTATTSEQISEWDSHSMQILRDVKERLNLSSEQEAARMLLVVGYEKLKTILPPSDV